MSLFLIHVIISCLWLIATHQNTAFNWLLGVLVGYIAIAAWCLITKKSIYHIRVLRVLGLIGFFIYELIHSSARVMWDIVTPTHKSNPGFIAMPLDAKTDAEIFFTANLISLTPGTLSMDISHDRRTLYIHAMFIDATTVASLKYFESKVLGVFR